MSFSFSFSSKSRKDALGKLDKESNVPATVKAMVAGAIAASPEGVLVVEANGHLADGVRDNYGTSQSVNFKLQSLNPE